MADDWLLFTLAGPMASFGGIAVGEMRSSDPVPSRSAVLGLIAAALGIRRHEAARLQQLGEALKVASRVESADLRQLDFHTAQAPKRVALKGRPVQTRRDELSVSKSGLNTVLSQREYHADFRATVAVQVSAPLVAAELCEALLRPRLTLYLGRKSFPLAWPLAPQVLMADDLQAALSAYDALRMQQQSAWLDAPSKLKWPFKHQPNWILDLEHGLVWNGPGSTRQILRRDEPRDRNQWLFADRVHLRVQGGSS